MKLNYFVKRCAAAVLSVLTIAFIFFSNPAVAAPVLADAGSKVQSKASEDASNTKGFVRETREKVKEAANSNASKVTRSDEPGGFFAEKAQKDARRIEKRADEDAARTQKAIDNSKNAVEKAVDGIKEAFGQ
jgi:cell pole-organizing protein PopZ